MHHRNTDLEDSLEVIELVAELEAVVVRRFL